MKFIVTRTSLLTNNDAIPCEEAQIKKVDGRVRFFVKLNSLKSLTDFVEKHGNIIIHKKVGSLNEIEIYDGYRE